MGKRLRRAMAVAGICALCITLSTPASGQGLVLADVLGPFSIHADESALPQKVLADEGNYLPWWSDPQGGGPAREISFQQPFEYAVWNQYGVPTFRGGSFRQNAAYGTVESGIGAFSVMWESPIGKMEGGTGAGIGWPGQPLIVKWPVELRGMMNIYGEKINTKALKEVIIGGLDGKLHFYDLVDGAPTRDSMELGAPSFGGLAIAGNASPMLGVGLSGEEGGSYGIVNLLSGQMICRIGEGVSVQGISSAALFGGDPYKSFMILGANSTLYTIRFDDRFDFYAPSLKLGLNTTGYVSTPLPLFEKPSPATGSVAAYNELCYFVDSAGILQCVNANSLTPEWAVQAGQTVLTPALDFADGGRSLALYTGNIVDGAGQTCSIRRYSAQSGKMLWEYQVEGLEYSQDDWSGCVASPVVGDQEISDLVIFTVTDSVAGSRVLALAKDTGQKVWETAMESKSKSSPVAVYSEEGGAWIPQAEEDGRVHLMKAKTGEIVSTLQLEGEIVASPAVYRNVMVIGTTDEETGYLYGILIE